ncbi:hypothetical protein LXL04_009067 [Taraxacum kok-saghyz]
MILMKTKAGSLKHTIVLRGAIYAGSFSRRWKLGKMNQAEIDELLSSIESVIAIEEVIAIEQSIHKCIRFNLGCASVELSVGDSEGQITQDIQYVKRQQTWTPAVEVKPYEGQLFDSFEDAFGFYKEYGRIHLNHRKNEIVSSL